MLLLKPKLALVLALISCKKDEYLKSSS